nr:MAG TPA: hypothetical protein [Caudoviricetes sp.]
MRTVLLSCINDTIISTVCCLVKSVNIQLLIFVQFCRKYIFSQQTVDKRANISYNKDNERLTDCCG